MSNKLSNKSVVTVDFKKIISKAIHDIQSPLASLQIILQADLNLPEQERIIRTSMMRIEDIVAEVLHQFNPTYNLTKINHVRQPLLVSSILSEIINNRKLKHNHSLIEFKYNLNKLNAFLFINAFPSDFNHIISTLINNAIEALPNEVGKVEIKLASNEEWVYISILDNGAGIPKDLLNSIKSDTPLDQSITTELEIGLKQIQDMLTRNHASFEIASSQSTNSHGTTITLRFPKVAPPDWSLENICILPTDTILILDDDTTLHNLWDDRFNLILKKMPSITIKHFFSSSKVIEYIQSLSNEQKQTIYFIYSNQLSTNDILGTEIIRKCQIERSLLITKHYIENDIKNFAIKNCSKILPKELINHVSLAVNQRLETSKGMQSRVHMVFVDDEKIVLTALVAKYFNNLIVDQYSNPYEFLKVVNQYPKDTKLILDNYYYGDDGLPYNIDGITIAQKLHNSGYTNLFLLSGESLTVPDYLKLILKSDFEGIKNLGI